MLLFLGYGALLISQASFAVGGSDSAGYACEAKMMVDGRIVQPVLMLDRLELPDRLERAFMPLAHEPGPRPRTMVPYYPPGYPIHLAVAGIFGSWQYAPHFVSPFAALLLVVATYFLARELGLSRLLALVSAAILAACAVLLFQAVQAMSDVTAALWATAAVVFALRSRKRDAWAAAAGAAFGMAVLVRPASAILVLSLPFALGWTTRAFALFAAAGAPFAGFQAWWNDLLYGSPLRTGYTGEGHGFAWTNFTERFLHYGKTIGQLFSPLVPLGWLLVPGDRRLPWRDRALLVVWLASYFLLYCFWGAYEAWWYTRYLLPAFPALVVGAVLVARDLLRVLHEKLGETRRSEWLSIGVAVVFLLVVAGFERRGIRRWKPLGIAEAEKAYPMAMDLVREKLPDRSLVVSMQASGALRYYTEFQCVRWDWLNADEFAEIRGKAEAKGYRLYALLAPFEIDQGVLTSRTPGNWKVLGAARDFNLFELE